MSSDLKNTKTENRTISEYVMRIQTLIDSLLAIGESISEHDKIDNVLDGLLDECNCFVMMIYGGFDSLSISNIEALLLVQVASTTQKAQAGAQRNTCERLRRSCDTFSSQQIFLRLWTSYQRLCSW